MSVVQKFASVDDPLGKVALIGSQGTPERLKWDSLDTTLNKAVPKKRQISQARGISMFELCTYLISCNLGKAALMEGLPAPVQNTSAEAAARGQTIESRFSGPACSDQRSCWPPRTRGACSGVMPFRGLKE